jgi:hypothetical protein
MILLQINTTACDGSDAFLPWLLWLIAAFILGLILGWLLKQIIGGGSAVAAIDNTKQDLTKIEGIGPKIEELLNKNGINSYEQLANASHSFLEKIISDAGPAFYTHRRMTNTWPAQAKLAQHEEWDELKKWQDVLKAGM